MQAVPPQGRVVRLRDAAAADAAEMARVYVQTRMEAFGEAPDPGDRGPAWWLARWHKYLTTGSTAQQSLGDGFALIAEAGGAVVGFAAYHHTRRWGCEAELQSIYVLTAHQGRGTGTRLLAEVTQRLRADGSRSLCVGYASDNPYRRFYFKHGAVALSPSWAAWRPLPDL